MIEEDSINNRIITDIEEISEFMDHTDFNKVVNKIIDYADIITENKLAGLINFKYDLNSTQANIIKNLLIKTQAISMIFNIASKGLKDLETEYISNIYSDTSHLDGFSSYISLRNIIENRLNHQTQQYNINMNKKNTTMAMPISELIGHTKTYIDLSKDNVGVSTKVQHGFISASLHDAYIILLNIPEWWDDKTYMKFFFNDSEYTLKNQLLISKKPRKALNQIKEVIENIINEFERINSLNEMKNEIAEKKSRDKKSKLKNSVSKKNNLSGAKLNIQNDKMLKTPFGKQYGQKIDGILDEIINNDKKIKLENTADEIIKEKIQPLYKKFCDDNKSLDNKNSYDDINLISEFLMNTNYDIKIFAEKFIQTDKKMSFKRFYTVEVQNDVKLFIANLYIIYFNIRFSSLFRIIKSDEMKKFACAYIIKRLYQKLKGGISYFSSYMIKIIGRKGGIKI